MIREICKDEPSGAKAEQATPDDRDHRRDLLDDARAYAQAGLVWALAAEHDRCEQADHRL